MQSVTDGHIERSSNVPHKQAKRARKIHKMYGSTKKFIARRNPQAYLLGGRQISRNRVSSLRSKRTSDQRQLTSVLRLHRAANPYQITPSSGRSVTFWRKVSRSIPLSQSAGFDGLGNNVNWGFSLGNLLGFLNGTFQYTVPISSVSEFQALFDYYKIEAVKMQIFFTRTNLDSSTIGMPLLLISNDFDDIAESMTANTMNERVGTRHVQLDSNNTNGINHYIKPKLTNVVVQTNPTTGVDSSSSSGVVFGTQWIDTATSNILHKGIKVVYDNQGLTSATVLGNVTFVFDICYVMKGYR